MASGLDDLIWEAEDMLGETVKLETTPERELMPKAHVHQMARPDPLDGTIARVA